MKLGLDRGAWADRGAGGGREGGREGGKITESSVLCFLPFTNFFFSLLFLSSQVYHTLNFVLSEFLFPAH